MQPRPPAARRDAVDVAREDGRQIGIDHRRVAAADELDQRRDLVADRDLGEAELARDVRQPRLVSGYRQPCISTIASASIPLPRIC
jgi:hypothetical protein